METTGIIGLYRGYEGIMEKKMKLLDYVRRPFFGIWEGTCVIGFQCYVLRVQLLFKVHGSHVQSSLLR